MNIKNKIMVEKICSELELKFDVVDANDVRDALYDSLNYCNIDIAVEGMASSIKDLYIIRRNMQGSEGEVSRREGGVSQSFEVGIPARIRSNLNRYRVANVRKFL